MIRKMLAAALAAVLVLAAALPASAANRFVFSPKEITVSEGETVQTVLDRDGAYAGDGEVVYTSGRPGVATVAADGSVTGVARGQATITATLMRNGKKAGQAQCTVKVLRPVQKVTLDTRRLNVYEPDDPAIAGLLREATEHRVIVLAAGASASLSAVCTPEDASNRRVSFSTTDIGVARVVSDQTLRGVQRGECDLVAASKSNPGVQDVYRLLVTQPVKKIQVTGPRSVAAGGTISLQAVCSPDDASMKNVTWASKQPGIASVDADGNVTGLKRGQATITATAADGSKVTASATVNVTQSATSVEFKQSMIAVNVGHSQQANASVMPANASDRGLTWSSSDEAIATVAGGKITGRRAGTCTVTAASRSDPDVRAEIPVVVSQLATRVEILNPRDELSIRVGEQVQLQWAMYPDDVTNREVSFRSAAPKIASVDANGLVTGLSKGTATVSVIAQDASKRKGEAKVHVIQPATGVSMQRPTYYVQQGLNGHVRAVVWPKNANNQRVYWTVEDPWICSIASTGDSTARVHGMMNGTTTVTATTEDGGFTASARVRVGDFNSIVLVEDLQVDANNEIRIVLRNMSTDIWLEDIYFTVECFDLNGGRVVCNKDGVGTSFEGSYPFEVAPLARTVHGYFRFDDPVIDRPLGSVILTVTGWKDSEGIAWTIPEEERVPRQWTRLFR